MNVMFAFAVRVLENIDNIDIADISFHRGKCLLKRFQANQNPTTFLEVRYEAYWYFVAFTE